MSGEITDTPAPVEQRKRRPIPIFEDRFAQYGQQRPYVDLSRGYLRKDILKGIENNLNELVDIKTGGKSIDNNNQYYPKSATSTIPVTSTVSATPAVEEKKIEKLIVEPIKHIVEEKKVENTVIFPAMIPMTLATPKVDDKTDNKNDIKIGISNIIPEKVSENKEIKSENKDIKTEIKSEITQIKNKENKVDENKKKIIKKKVKYMNGEEPQTNVSPEDRRRMRKAELKEFQDEEEISKKIRESRDIAIQNKLEIENLASKLDKNAAEVHKDINSKFENLDSKFERFDSKFESLDSKFDLKFDSKFGEIGAKLKETCEGIDCLKKDIKKQELVECPECGKNSVPYKSSYCPDCGVKISSWTEEDGITPLKFWKPTWAKLT